VRFLTVTDQHRSLVCYNFRMMNVSDKKFREIVAEAIDEIPAKYSSFIKNLAFVVEDEPNSEQKKRLSLASNQSLYGLYEGVPLTRRSSGYNLVLPDKITVFKLPHETVSTSLEDLKKRVKHTVWHEVAHYYGLGHGRIEELEQK